MAVAETAAGEECWPRNRRRKRGPRQAFSMAVGDRFGSILADQFQQLGQLAAQVSGRYPPCRGDRLPARRENKDHRGIEQSLLCLRALGGGTHCASTRSKRSAPRRLAAAPAARIGDDFVDAVVDGDGTGIGLEREPAAHKTRAAHSSGCHRTAGGDLCGPAPPPCRDSHRE